MPQALINSLDWILNISIHLTELTEYVNIYIQTSSPIVYPTELNILFKENKQTLTKIDLKLTQLL